MSDHGRNSESENEKFIKHHYINTIYCALNAVFRLGGADLKPGGYQVPPSNVTLKNTVQ